MKPRNSSFLDGIAVAVTGFGVGCLVGLSVSPVLQTVLSSVLALVAGAAAAVAGLRSSEDAGPVKGLAAAANPLPIALLVIGILAGAVVGLHVRTHELLGSGVAGEVARWRITKLPEDVIARRLFDKEYPPSAREAVTNDASDDASDDAADDAGLTNASGAGVSAAVTAVSLSEAASNPADQAGQTKKTGKARPGHAAVSGSSGGEENSGRESTRDRARLAVLYNDSTEICDRLCGRTGNRLMKALVPFPSDPRVAAFARACRDSNDLKLFVETFLCRCKQ